MTTRTRVTPSRSSDRALRRFEDIRELLPDVENPTPLVRVRNAVTADNVYLKLEWLNPFGSIKDRAASYLIRGLLGSGSLENREIVEASSGNTAIALAALGAVSDTKGHDHDSRRGPRGDEDDPANARSRGVGNTRRAMSRGSSQRRSHRACTVPRGLSGWKPVCHGGPVREPGQRASPLRDHRSRDLEPDRGRSRGVFCRVRYLWNAHRHWAVPQGAEPEHTDRRNITTQGSPAPRTQELR